MGLFKDGFKAYKGAKDLGDYHGGMPSMRDAIKDVRAVSDDRGQGEILKNGTPTKAVVQGFMTPVPGDRFAMQVPLDVYPPQGGDPYRVDYVFPTARMKAALSVGMEVPVKVDPADPQRVAVQWDAQKGAIAAAGGDMAATMQGLSNTYGGAADAAMRQAQAGGGAGASDPATKIEQLAKLRDAGAITEEEFAAKKAQLLEQL
jgi:uncharacterized protein YukE